MKNSELDLAYNQPSVAILIKRFFFSLPSLILSPHYSSVTLMLCLTITAPLAIEITDAREVKGLLS